MCRPSTVTACSMVLLPLIDRAKQAFDRRDAEHDDHETGQAAAAQPERRMHDERVPQAFALA